MTFTCQIASAQELHLPPDDAAKTAENLFAQQDPDMSYEELYETVLQYLSSPLDINKASEAELRTLFLLNDHQVRDLLAHRALNGQLLSIYELQSIGSFTPESIRSLAPFITVGSTQTSSNLLLRIITEPNNYIMSRYERIFRETDEQSSADSIHKFTGSPGKQIVRFRVSHPGDFSLGFMAEKDPGESSILDYTSFHFQRIGQKRILNFIAGDFQAHFGQGLVLGGGFGMGKGSETILTMRRSTLGFIPWTSSGETGFFRGLGTSIALSKSIIVHGFVSRKRQDAALRVDPDSGAEVAFLQSTGLHRNAIEKATQRTTTEENAGAALELRNRSLQAGLVILHSRWNKPLAGGQELYNRFDPQGLLLTNASAFANYTFRNLSFFGEAAHTSGYGAGAVGGVLASVNKYTDVSVVIRGYARNFGSPYGSAIAENSTARNEKGIYWGWKFQPSKAWLFAAYVDVFRFPWLQYRAYTTSGSGHDYLLRTTWKPRKDVVFFAQVREERKARNSDNGAAPAYQTSTGIKRNYCLNADYAVGVVSMRTRIQGSTMADPKRTGGVALYQDFSLEKPRWSLSVRHVLFDTEDFDNRQYSYEPDMWMAYSFPAHSGSGIRSMAMVRLRISRKVDLWVRWAQTRQEPEIQEPSERIASVTRDLKVQIRLKI
jgi:hypothetical protein